MFFRHTCVAKVGLPREVWEPIRKLRDSYDVPVSYLANAWDVSDVELLKVLLAARLQSLDAGVEVEGALFIEELTGEFSHD